MTNFRTLFLTLAVLAALVSSGCKDDTTDPDPAPEKISSHTQLTEWMEQLGAVLRATNTPGTEASRILAYASVAYYEGYAFNSEEMVSLVGQLQGLDALPIPESNTAYNFGIVAEAAMYRVLDEMFENAPINIQIVLSSTYTEHERDYAILGVAEPIIDRSRAFGTLLGNAILDWAAHDGYGSLNNCTLSVPNGPNQWQPTPPTFGSPEAPCWGDLRPFTYASDQLVSLCNPGIPAQVNTDPASPYYNDLREVYELGNGLNPAQVEIARFWNDGPGTFTVPGHYVSILKQLTQQKEMTGEQAVTAFAQLCIAMADTYISTYKLKYTYFRPRPVTMIRQELDMDWSPEMDDPLTPEYPSLHSTMAYAATQVFINLFGDMEIRDNTHASVLGLDERIYSSITEMGREAAYSRLYAGTNLRTTIVNSEYHGRCIAQRANELFLLID